MDWKLILTTFTTIFLAELGDKTQLAAISIAGKTQKPLSVFIGGALALVLVTAIGVIVGESLLNIISPETIRKLAATGFVIMGLLMFFDKL